MNPSIRAAQGANRNFGLEGAGKGDADRTHDKATFNENLEQVNFPRVPASQDPEFQKSKRGFVKVYGVQREPKHAPEDVVAPLPEHAPTEFHDPWLSSNDPL